MVPVVLGGFGKQDYEKVAPGSSFIHADDFNSLQQLAEYLVSLDQDDATYSEFFSWQKHMRMKGFAENIQASLCQLCQELHKAPSEQKPTRSFGDLSGW